MDTLPQTVKHTVPAALLPAVSVALVVAALAVNALTEPTSDQVTRATRAPAPGDYANAWRRDTNTDLARTLQVNRIDDCSEMAYRSHRTMYGEYLLYCSSDGGRRWTAWRVWTGAQRVAGPFSPDPLVPPPQ